MTRAVMALTIAALALPAAAGAAGFEKGVAAGEMTSSSATVWTRAPRAGRLTLEVAAGVTRYSSWNLRARAADDRTVRFTLTHLAPGTRFRYRFRQGAVVSEWGSFVTAPREDSDGRVRFAISGDADATPGPDGKPGFNRFQVYARMAAERNDFNVNLGDTMYSDSEVAGSKPALTVAAKRQKYRQGLALPALRALRAGTGLYSHPDDHEYVNDFSVPEHGAALYRAGVEAFTDYAPAGWSAKRGFYRTFRWGRNLELFFLDERSFRSATVARQCNGDLAPTAPPSVRAALATLIPSLAKPVPPACLAALADPSRTMLGAAQESAFLRAIRASSATFKVVVNEVPAQQLYQLPYDRWEGYAAARKRLLDGLVGVRNVVFLATDTHANLVGEIRRRTLEDGGPVGTGIWEAVTGPVATRTYAKKIEAVTGVPGTGGLVAALFLKPPPPRGIGLRCAAIDVFSYSEVVVTATKLTVTPKTATGARVGEATGSPCAPLVVPAR